SRSGARGRNPAAASFRGGAAALEELDRLAVAVQRADVDVVLAAAHAARAPAALEPRCYQGTQVHVAASALAPQRLELAQHARRRAKGAPDPARRGVLALDLDLAHPAALVGDHGVEQLRAR